MLARRQRPNLAVNIGLAAVAAAVGLVNSPMMAFPLYEAGHFTSETSDGLKLYTGPPIGPPPPSSGRHGPAPP
jgi:hypothetical protein